MSEDPYVKIVVTGIASVLITLILSIAAYNVVDRVEQGHAVVTTQTVVTPTK